MRRLLCLLRAAWDQCTKEIHLDRHRCSIYPTRPHACQTFYCSWAFGNFEESDQPSKIGVVVGIFPHQGVLLAGMMVDSKKADMRRAWQIFAELALLFPHVQMVIDDEVIYVLRAGDIKPRKGKIMPRPRGDYEGTHYVLEDR
jgi:Fe-S-cluster containining protein